MKNLSRTIHFRINVNINENDYQWYDPTVRKDLDFQIPLEMFSSKLFSTMVEKLIETANAEFPEVRRLFDEAEAEKARLEAEVKVEQS